MESKTICLVIVRADLSCEIFRAQAAQSATGRTMTVPGQPLEVHSSADDLIPIMLADGWIPVRETGLGNGDALIVFHRASS